MIEFHTIGLQDKPWMDAALARGEDHRGCEYGFSSLYLWRKAYQHEVGEADGFLVVRLRGPLGHAYLYPTGGTDRTALLRDLSLDAAERGERFRLTGMDADQAAELERRYPGRFVITAERDSYDYLYDIDRLADLPGKKLHNKRNHISYFTKTWEDWRFEPLCRDNLDECLAMDRDWYLQSREREGAEEAQDLNYENGAIRDAVNHFEELGMEGGLIRVEGKVVAFTMGDPLGKDCYDVHFEKAYGDMRGAYPIINQEFARYVREKHPEVRWLNREDDMGVPGLRKAKESYYPDQMVEKYSAVLPEVDETLAK